MDSDSELYRSQSPITKLQDRLNNCYKVQKTSENQQIVQNCLEAQNLLKEVGIGSEKNISETSNSMYDPTSLETSNAAISYNPFTNNWKEYDSTLNLQNWK